MKERAKIITIILVSVIVVLLLILAYGVYTGVKVKAEIARLNDENSRISADNENLTSSLKYFQDKYDLLINDVAKIYKTCMKQNACLGRYPGISWYCNNTGDEVSDPSHICFCDSSCNLNATHL